MKLELKKKEFVWNNSHSHIAIKKFLPAKKKTFKYPLKLQLGRRVFFSKTYLTSRRGMCVCVCVCSVLYACQIIIFLRELSSLIDESCHWRRSSNPPEKRAGVECSR